MINLADITKEFSGKRVLSIGDMICDEYVYGEVSRISREAPVLILKFTSNMFKVGGAANAISNLKALGAKVYSVGVVGNDNAGEEVISFLGKMKVDIDGIIVDKACSTVTKTRIMAGSYHTAKQQVIRVDKEKNFRINSISEAKMLTYLDEVLDTMDAVLISDYGYKTISKAVYSAISRYVRNKKLVLVVDSRYGLLDYKYATAVTPNETEVEDVLHCSIDGEKSLCSMAERLKSEIECENVIITRGSKGMMILDKNNKSEFIPIHGNTDVVDATGAGDTVSAVVTLALSAGASAIEAARLANYAGSIVVMKTGAATATQKELVDVVKHASLEK
ncbi:bifunctional hydroxymethylpyrimidine kinase/phosphomethylpyrimidine kinase [bacterium]|nr:bifunctional hydroxymethylpyrimidine kinase/phosphomethylpyrimidine kinase [bacterium]